MPVTQQPPRIVIVGRAWPVLPQQASSGVLACT